MAFALIKKIYCILSKFFKLYFPEKNYLYKIEEIDEFSNRIVISCRGKGVTLVSTIEDVGYDEYIINFLPPHQACWVGYYFGKKWNINKEDKRNKKKFNSHPKHYDSNYKIICQNRLGEIIFQNAQSGSVYKMEPIELAKSKTITKFNSSQAFYVGFLAALKNIKDSKKKTHNQNTNKPHLQLVK
jgi:hypothetical protein